MKCYRIRNEDAMKIIAQAFKECDFDCSDWPEDIRLELALAVLLALAENGFYAFRLEEQP